MKSKSVTYTPICGRIDTHNGLNNDFDYQPGIPILNGIFLSRNALIVARKFRDFGGLIRLMRFTGFFFFVT